MQDSSVVKVRLGEMLIYLYSPRNESGFAAWFFVVLVVCVFDVALLLRCFAHQVTLTA